MSEIPKKLKAESLKVTAQSAKSREHRVKARYQKSKVREIIVQS
jgi:hypothetical protein